MIKGTSFIQLSFTIIILILYIIKIPDLISIYYSIADYIYIFLFYMLAVFFMLSNLYIFLEKEEHRTFFLKCNFIIMAFQVLTLSIVGFSYDFSFGPRAIIFLEYDNNLEFYLHLSSFKTTLRLFHTESSAIIVGINLFPLIASYAYLQELDKSSSINDPLK